MQAYLPLESSWDKMGGAGAHPERSSVRKQTQKKVAGNDVLHGSQDNDLLIETLFFPEGTSSSYSLEKEHQ